MPQEFITFTNGYNTATDHLENVHCTQGNHLSDHTRFPDASSMAGEDSSTY